MNERLSDEESALLALGELLRESGYRFITPTPATHALVNARTLNCTAKSLIDVFGWSRPFGLDILPKRIADLADHAKILDHDAPLWRSAVRFSSLGQHLFVHTAHPTTSPDAVFFGPDTYRFARVLSAVSANWHLPARVRVIDIGCGSGAGGIHLSRLLEPRADIELVLGDINPQALRLARINAALNTCRATVADSDVLNGIHGQADIVIANPPYLVDSAQRVYRHGGGEFGGALSVRILNESLVRLRHGGRLVLYTGSAIVDGVDTFLQTVKPGLDRSGRSYTYEEIDPDVFGEELAEEAYARADRIAVVALSVG